MIVEVFGHVEPWTEEEYLGLGETPERVELFDGSLFVSSASTPLHQYVSMNLARQLRDPADVAGLHVLAAVNVRLRPGRILIPDLVITGDIDFNELVIDVRSIRLVCEIASPSTAAIDRGTKKDYYATAGIPWYLICEPETAALGLYRLDRTDYVEHATTEPDETLRLTDPVVIELNPADLQRPR